MSGMNLFVISGQIVGDPQLRYTSNDQKPIAELVIQFVVREGEQPEVLKVLAWGKLAERIGAGGQYVAGATVLVKGRMQMDRIEMEGYKETRAVLNASSISLGAFESMGDDPDLDKLPAKSAPVAVSSPAAIRSRAEGGSRSATAVATKPAQAAKEWDDIPF